MCNVYRIKHVCTCTCTYRKMLKERKTKSYFYRELQTYVLGTNAFKLDSALKIFVTPLTISKRWQILIFPRLHDHLPEAPPKDFWTSLFEPYVQNLISDPYSYQIIKWRILWKCFIPMRFLHFCKTIFYILIYDK